MEGNIKRLVAIDNKYNTAPVYIAAKEDPMTKTVRDYSSRLTEDERSRLTVTVDLDTQLRVSHLMQFDLNNPNDKLFFEIIKEDLMIAGTKEEVNPGLHRYYIEDKEKEASASIGKTRLKAKAFKIVALLSLDDMVNYARILGKYAKDLSNNQVEALLYDICESKPKNIIEISEDPDLKFKVFLNKLIDKNIVLIVNGKYMNGNEVIGINQDYAIQWVRNPENSVVVNQWASTLSFDGIARSSVKKTAPKETKKQVQRKTTSKT